MRVAIKLCSGRSKDDMCTDRCGEIRHSAIRYRRLHESDVMAWQLESAQFDWADNCKGRVQLRRTEWRLREVLLAES